MKYGTRTRVLVVEDSLTIRKAIVEILAHDPELEVVGQTRDGKEAIELTARLRPDVITMDMMLYDMSGLEATQQIMAKFPTPILVVSASLNRGEVYKTYEALASGALDVFEKPSAGMPTEAWGKALREKLKKISKIPVITHVRALKERRTGSTSSPGVSISQNKPRAFAPAISGRQDLRLVAIGASTGGPRALTQVLGDLPPDFGLPILVVIHMAEAFGPAFASWLGSQISIPTALAEDNEFLGKRGETRVIVAPPGKHMVVDRERIRLSLAPERHSCRPSVDVLFESIAEHFGSVTVACLLTGMGHDGARGLLEIRNAGGTTIAQDEETSIVFGMPKEAIKLGGATFVLPIQAIGPALVKVAS